MKNKRGFTLVELIVTIALLAVIGTVIVVNMTGMFKKQEQGEKTRLESAIKSAAEAYIYLEDINVDEEGSNCIKISDLANKKYLKASEIEKYSEKYVKVEGSKYTIVETVEECVLSNKKYTITFEKNLEGEEVTLKKSSLEVEKNKVINLKEYIPTAEGYKFVGWATTKDGIPSESQKIKVTKSMKLYAIWTAKTYTVRYETNGGSKVLEQKYKYKSKITPAEATKEHYVFSGWYLDSELTNELPANATMPSNDITLYAKWEANKVVINIKRNNKDYENSGIKVALCRGTTETNYATIVGSGSQVIFSGVPNGEYSVCAGKDSVNKESLIDSGVIIKVNNNNPEATINYYRLTLNVEWGISSVSNGETNLIEKPTVFSKYFLYNSSNPQEIEIAAEVSDGYEWNKWTKTSGTDLKTFEPNQRTQTIKMGEGNTILSPKATYIATPTITTQDHDTFSYYAIDADAYYVSKNATTPIDDSSAINSFALDAWTTATNTGDLNLEEGTYYVWAKNATSGGSVSTNKAKINAYSIARSVGNGTTLTTKYDSTALDNGSEFTTRMYVLEGTPIWAKVDVNAGFDLPSLKHGNTEMNVNGEYFTASKSETIFSRATPIFKITLDKNGGTGGTNVIYEKYGIGFYLDSNGNNVLNQIEIPINSGHEFLGYYTSDGSKVINNDGTLNISWSTFFREDVTLKAHWERKTYTVTLNIHAEEGYEPTVYYNGEETTSKTFSISKTATTSNPLIINFDPAQKTAYSHSSCTNATSVFTIADDDSNFEADILKLYNLTNDVTCDIHYYKNINILVNTIKNYTDNNFKGKDATDLAYSTLWKEKYKRILTLDTKKIVNENGYFTNTLVLGKLYDNGLKYHNYGGYGSSIWIRGLNNNTFTIFTEEIWRSGSWNKLYLCNNELDTSSVNSSCQQWYTSSSGGTPVITSEEYQYYQDLTTTKFSIGSNDLSNDEKQKLNNYISNKIGDSCILTNNGFRVNATNNDPGSCTSGTKYYFSYTENNKRIVGTLISTYYPSSDYKTRYSIQRVIYDADEATQSTDLYIYNNKDNYDKNKDKYYKMYYLLDLTDVDSINSRYFSDGSELSYGYYRKKHTNRFYSYFRNVGEKIFLLDPRGYSMKPGADNYACEKNLYHRTDYNYCANWFLFAGGTNSSYSYYQVPINDNVVLIDADLNSISETNQSINASNYEDKTISDFMDVLERSYLD